MNMRFLTSLLLASVASAQTPLTDGKTFDGWEGDTTTQWRIEDGAFTSGALDKKQPRNDYLATKKDFGDFELTLKWKLQGTEGFVNGGVHFRSKRVPKGTEVSGFQADLGAGYDGALYDHLRRSKVIQRPSKEVLEKAKVRCFQSLLCAALARETAAHSAKRLTHWVVIAAPPLTQIMF